MDPVSLIVGAVLGAVIVPAWYFSKREKQKRRLRTAKRWSLAALPDDTFGKVVGTARVLEQTLIAPISGRPCLLYLVVVTADDRSDASALLREVVSVPFVIEDDTGRAVVDPRDAAIVLVQDRFRISGPHDPRSAEEVALLKRHGITLTTKTYWYRESIIEPGEVVALFGAGGREPDPDAPPAAEYRGAPAMRLRMSSARSFKLLISDDPKLTA